MEGFKKAYYRKIPAYFNEETHDLLIDWNVWFDFVILELDGLPIFIKKED